eukprot:c12848_g6_i1.p1 GENE.c12848_g6_i1~~c12848_g6_i1.p1  ORF type:complete len:575 (-),score=147.91 c12848_g6_i1:160-1884(-)
MTTDEPEQPTLENGTGDAQQESNKTKRARQRLQKKKLQKKNKHKEEPTAEVKIEKDDDAEMKDLKVEVHYVGDTITTAPETASLAAAFSDVFGAFLSPEELFAEKKPELADTKADTKAVETKVSTMDEDDDLKDDDDDGKPKVSKRAQKRQNRLGIAELKQLVTRPDVVEVWDTTAADPRTLVFLKAYRNVVPVPRHWCQKRKYLQGKRGIEKPPFKLPAFIEATGIQKMREAYQAKDDEKRAKQKQRERVAPKMGRMDINYQVLHDAFFKYQTKPEMTVHGDIYYEGKEFEVSLKAKRPGALTEELREALTMDKTNPPPWLLNMQRYGPPPCYPNLRIPGINCPIPAGCSYGFAPGEWGKPPVDEHNRPLYGGNPFDPPGSETSSYEVAEQHKRWGQIEDDAVSDDEQYQNADEDADDVPDGAQTVSGIATGTGTATPRGGIDSVAVGMQTPDSSIDLRKALRTGKDTPAEEPTLYQVLPEQQAGIGAAAFGSEKTYQVQSVSSLLKEKRKDSNVDKVQVSLNPDELENMDETILKQKYAQQIQADQAADDDDDDGPRPKKSSRERRLREFKF